MRRLIQRTRDTLFTTPDTLCLERARLVTEAYRRWEGQPPAVLRARAFAYVLGRMTLDMRTNPIFAGNTSSRPRAWMLLPEYGFTVPDQAVIEDPRFEGFLDGNAIPRELREFWRERSFGGGAAVGHLAVDLDRVLSRGLEGIIAEAESQTDSDSETYRQAMVICCHAVIAWAKRYSEAARQAAKSCPDRVEKAAHLRVAEACHRVPAKPARNLFEALQSIVLVQLAIHIEGHGYSVSPGLLDRVLEPFYEDTPEITELLAAFMLKLSANSLWGSHSKTQTITLGGLDSTGRDRCNPLTLRFLEAVELIRMPDPHLFLRWHEKIDAQVKERAMAMLAAGLTMPMLVGDEQTAAGFISAGIRPEDAWDYCVIGCNELGIPGKMADSAAGPGLNHLAVLNETLESADTIGSMDALMAAARTRMKDALASRMRNWSNHRPVIGQKMPTPFTSALMDENVARGTDLHVEMRYNRPGIVERGLVNVVNALAAIEQVVFTEGLPLPKLVEAMRGGFPDESLRLRLLKAPRWGQDDDRADRWARAWLEMRESV